jgi:hypothetical protein
MVGQDHDVFKLKNLPSTSLDGIMIFLLALISLKGKMPQAILKVLGKAKV